MAKNSKTEQEEPLEKKLWKAADKLRKNMDAAEYKHVVLGLIFLKYISDAFEELYQQLLSQKADGADAEDKNEYLAEKVFFVPATARWSYIQGRATLPTIGKDIDDAMDAIEKDNTSLKGVLPKVFAQEKLDKSSLGGLINLIGTATLGTKEAQSKDLLGKVYEYFLGEFALAEGKKGGQFYTPSSVVKLLVEIIEPFEGRVFDPCCGSGGMFVQSEKFILSHQDHYKNKKSNSLQLNLADRISIFGQESNQTTWRLAKMNLAIRGIDGSNIKWNNEGSFLNDAHKDLKADYILANPPFNDSDWSGNLLQSDSRWKYGVPPVSNANFAWVQHMLFHLAPTGRAGIVLSNGSLSSNTSNEGKIRQEFIENNLVECIISLPDKLFYSTQIPACLWFISKAKKRDDILLIDARKLGKLTGKKLRTFNDENINYLKSIFKKWESNEGYEDISGFCKSVSSSEIKDNDYSLIPGNYVGVAEIEFNEEELNIELEEVKNTLPDLTSSSNSTAIEINALIQKFSSFGKLEHKEYRLGDFLTLKGGGAIKGTEFTTEGYPVIKIKNVKANKLVLDTLDYISDENAIKYKDYKIEYNDLLITMTGNRFEGGMDSWVGKVALFREAEDYYLNQRVGILRLKEGQKIASLNYISFLLSTEYMQEYFVKIARGSGGQSNLSPDQILGTLVKLPSLEIQEMFSSIVEVYYNKIEIENQIQNLIFKGCSALFQKSMI